MNYSGFFSTLFDIVAHFQIKTGKLNFSSCEKVSNFTRNFLACSFVGVYSGFSDTDSLPLMEFLIFSTLLLPRQPPFGAFLVREFLW